MDLLNLKAKKSNSLRWKLGGLLLFLTFLFCWAAWILIHPKNLLTNQFRPKISNLNASVIMGPYPVESDLHLLKSNQVTTLVSLLDPRLPYEKILLELEISLGKKLGFEIFNFPMTSILGQRMGENYNSNAQEAAKKIQESLAKGKVYVHCYLGLHRVKAVTDILQKNNVITDTYLVRQGERSDEAKIMDLAQAAFDEGSFEESLKILDDQKIDSERALILKGWTNYKLGHVEKANQQFQQLLFKNAASLGALDGSGYCALRLNHLPEAELTFSKILAIKPNDPSALEGMGYATYRQQKWTLARSYLKKALIINPHNKEIQQLLAHIPTQGQPSSP